MYVAFENSGIFVYMFRACACRHLGMHPSFSSLFLDFPNTYAVVQNVESLFNAMDLVRE